MSTPPSARTVLRRCALVAAGGMIGTAARLGIGMLISSAPLGVLAVNLIGALLLGILTVRISHADLRVFLGTGMLGSFTTYSAFAVDSVQLWAASGWLTGAYIAVSLIGGLAAAALGIRLGRRFGRGAAA